MLRNLYQEILCPDMFVPADIYVLPHNAGLQPGNGLYALQSLYTK